MRTLLKDLSVTLLSRILCSICNDSEEELIFFLSFSRVIYEFESKRKRKGREMCVDCAGNNYVIQRWR